jgi:hypothetical protein
MLSSAVRIAPFLPDFQNLSELRMYQKNLQKEKRMQKMIIFAAV